MKKTFQRDRLLLYFLVFASGLAVRNALLAGQEAKVSTTPYASIGQVRYAGPGRLSDFDITGPVVRIGVLAPLHGPEKADGQAIVLAAQLALKEASRRAIRGGQRLELAIGDEAGPSWGRTADTLLRLVRDDRAVAVVTSANGATAHLAEQVGNRMGVPILTLSTDPTTTEIDLPWIFRLGPSDSQLTQKIIHEVVRQRPPRSILLVAQGDHDGRIGAQEYQKAAQAMGGLPITCVFLDPQRPDFDALMLKLGAHPPGAIVLWTRPQATRNLVMRIRRARIESSVYLSPQAAQDSSSLDRAPSDISGGNQFVDEGVWTTVWHQKNSPVRKDFEQKFMAEAGRFPSPVAAEAFDAVTLVAEAFLEAGSNRARVRDQIAQVKNFSGASGAISFDGQGNNNPELRLVRLTDYKGSPWPN